MAQRKLELAKREDFFSDPFFSDILKESDDLFQKRLVAFKDHKSLVVPGKSDTAHNLQVSASNDAFLIQLELPGFNPEDFSLKTKDDVIILEANHKSGDADQETSRKYVKEFKMPQGVLRDRISSAYTAEGVLTIEAPRKLEAPKGAEISEAMTAASKAYTTEDGTKVAQDSQASSQMIAASTQSEDGSSKSSMSFSSSSSSSSTMTSSSFGGPMPSLGGMPDMGMPSLGMGGMSSNMDDMMKSMMSKMSMDGGSSGMSDMMKSSSSMMSSSSSTMMSSSSSSMSSSSKMMESSMLGGGGGMPPLRMQMPAGLNIEEMSTAGTEISNPPAYTVTSPPPPPLNEEMSFQVKGEGNQNKSTADATVLLKLKEGDEYKLVLNMQQYKPENIVVKLNDRELTITAEEGSTENFYQKHVIPSGIDLDALTSSFSSDGILVIKAPKLK